MEGGPWWQTEGSRYEGKRLNTFGYWQRYHPTVANELQQLLGSYYLYELVRAVLLTDLSSLQKSNASTSQFTCESHRDVEPEKLLKLPDSDVCRPLKTCTNCPGPLHEPAVLQIAMNFI